MNAAFASEWIKLRRRGMYAALAAVVGLSSLIVLLVINHAGGNGEHSFLTLAELTASGGFARIVGHTGDLLKVITLGVFASVFASEFSQGTMRNLLVRQPHRLRLLAGKYLATVTATAAALAAALAVSIPVGLLAAGTKHVSTSAWWTSSGLSALAHTEINLLLACIGYGTIGVLLAIVFRSPVAAIGAGLAYLLPIEGILSAVITGATRWLPGQLLDALATGGTPDVTYRAAALTLAVYGILAATITGLLFSRPAVASEQPSRGEGGRRRRRFGSRWRSSASGGTSRASGCARPGAGSSRGLLRESARPAAPGGSPPRPAGGQRCST